MADERLSTTVELRELHPTVERLLTAQGRLRIRGECQRPTINGGYATFSLCVLAEGQPHVVRVRLDPARIGAIRNGISSQTGLSLEACLVNGRLVTVIGTVRVRDGAVELLADSVYVDDLHTVGDVQAELTALPANWERLGIATGRLAASHRPGPLTPKRELSRIAVVTGRATQALEDFTNAFRGAAGRAADEPFHVPCPVQGREAADELIRTLKRIEAKGQADAICIIRGGGPWFHLWPFNSLHLAKAVRDLSIPVYAAVGHASDRSALDCAADYACDTPGILGQRVGRASAASVSTRATASTGGLTTTLRKPDAVPDAALIERRLAEVEKARLSAEADRDRARDELEQERARTEQMRMAGIREGVRLGERAAVHRASGIALVVTLLGALAVCGLGMALGGLGFGVVGLIGMGISARLCVEWVRTAPGRTAPSDAELAAPKH